MNSSKISLDKDNKNVFIMHECPVCLQNTVLNHLIFDIAPPFQFINEDTEAQSG